MTRSPIHILLLYNDDTHIAHGNPEDLLAIQCTVQTTRGVHQALLELGYDTGMMAVHDSLELLEQTLQDFPRESTLVFNNCDGFNGSNRDAALVVRLLEEMGFRHTGGSAEAVELCIDKPRAKQRLLEHGIPSPPFQIFEDPQQDFSLAFPVIVKPAGEDGSIGITLRSVVSNRRALRRQVRQVLKTYEEPVLVEAFIPGRELAVALLGNDPVETLPITEDDYSQIGNPLERLLTYESKWDETSTYYNIIPSRTPADLTPQEEQIVRHAAVSAFHAIGLRDFGRVDIRFQDGIPYVIDINELPDLALDAGFWRSALAAGMTYPQMIDRIVQCALRREGLLP